MEITDHGRKAVQNRGKEQGKSKSKGIKCRDSLIQGRKKIEF